MVSSIANLVFFSCSIVLCFARIDSVSRTDYLTIAVDCRDTRIKITTQTLDPFSGVLYVQPSSAIRRGHQGPSHCRVEGRGRHEVSLDISPGQCGWRREGSLVSLNLYMQYDPHVQQVLDEQLTVECDMATRTGSVVDMGVLETGNQVASVPLTASMGTGSSWAEEGEVQDEIVIGDNALFESKKDEIEEVNMRLFDRRQRMEDTDSVVTGWLDINQDGYQIHDPLQEGQIVRLSAKVKQQAMMDTLLTRCMLATESGDLLELTDEFGCTRDGSIVSNFYSVVNDITMVKETTAQLTVPTIASGRKIESVKIKCNLAVCKEKCPMISCDRQNPPITAQDSIVLETQALFARKSELNFAEEVNHEISHLLGASAESESQLCLSPTRLVLAFGVLIVIIIASLLLSCYLWIKARKRMLPRPPMPIQRVPYMMPNRARPYIRVMT